MDERHSSDFENEYLRRHPELLSPYERKVYSQNGEDGVIEEILERIGTDSKFAVEFGVEDGSECNTRYLREVMGWDVLQMDGRSSDSPFIKTEYITAENVNRTLAKYKVPENLDLLSIDIDSNDFWVWKALDRRYRPRMVVIEYNATIAPSFARTVAYNPKFKWDGTNYFGASLLALYWLGKDRGYELVYCNETGINAFFVRADLISDRLLARTPQEAYRAPGFGFAAPHDAWTGHLPTERRFVEVDDRLHRIKRQRKYSVAGGIRLLKRLFVDLRQITE